MIFVKNTVSYQLLEKIILHHTGLDPVDGSGRPWQALFGGQVAEVEVDTATGEVQLLGIWACHDVGKAINPKGVEGQIEGEWFKQ